MKRSSSHASPRRPINPSPEQKRPREGTPTSKDEATVTPSTDINFLAYDVKTEAARTLQKLLLTDKIAEATRIVMSNHAVGILMNFKNWEKVAQFYQWSTRGEQTRQLLSTLRVSCGPIDSKSPAYYDACEIIEKRATDQIVTEEQLEKEPDPDTKAPNAEESPHFYHYLSNGVFCQYCEDEHLPVRPSC